MASNGQLLPIMGATPHKLIILSFLWTVTTFTHHTFLTPEKLSFPAPGNVEVSSCLSGRVEDSRRE